MGFSLTSLEDSKGWITSEKNACFFDAFPGFVWLSALKCYEEMTARHKDPCTGRVPVSIQIKPYKPECIAQWVKDILSEAGVDTRIKLTQYARLAAKSKGVRNPNI